MIGTLYGVGVGPGASEMITVQAVRILQSVDVVLAAASPRNDYSTALNIAMPHLRQETVIERLEFPMTRDTAVLHAAWKTAAQKTQAILRSGKLAAFITLGDPLIYSTFGYLLKTLRALQEEDGQGEDFPVEIIPGITSFQAAAARTETILCEAHENLLILPGINGTDALQQGLNYADNAVILKAYKNFSAIQDALHSAGCAEKSLLASYVGQEEENIVPLQEAPSVPPYLSLVLAKK